MEKLMKIRWILAVLFLLAILGLSAGIQRAVIPDNSLKVWFVENDPIMKSYEEFHKNFGNDEVILIGVHLQGDNDSTLARLGRFSTEAMKIDGIEKVESLADYLRDGTSFETIKANPVLNQMYISEDNRVALVWIRLKTMADIDVQRDRIVDEVYRIADDVFAAIPHQIGGIGVIYSALNRVTQSDLGKLLGISYLLIFATVWMVYRNLKILAAVIVILICAVIGALGAYGLMGHQINMVTVSLPTLIVILGIADVMHFPTTFIQTLEENSNQKIRSVAIETLRRVVLPCLMTTLTTAIGFLSLASSPMAAMRDFGIYTGIGLLLAFIGSIIFMAICFNSLKPTHNLRPNRIISAFLDFMGTLVITRPWFCGILCLAIFAVALFGMTRLENDTYTIGYLPDQDRVVTDHTTLEQVYGPYTPLEFVIRSKNNHSLFSSDILLKLSEFESKVKSIDGIASVFSLQQLYAELGKSWGLVPNHNLSPATVEKINGMLLDKSGCIRKDGIATQTRKLLSHFIGSDCQSLRVTLTSKMMSAQEVKYLLEKINKVARDTLPDGYEFSPSGYVPLYVRIIDYVMETQIYSFFWALLTICLLMLIWLRSFRLGFISIFPNIFPSIAILGFMGLAGIHLDIATAIVAAVILGIAFDDTVHFLYHWRQCEQRGLSWADSVKDTFAHVGHPAVTTALLMVLGYAVFLLADVKTLKYFGALTIGGAAVGIIAELMVTPLLLKIMPLNTVKKH